MLEITISRDLAAAHPDFMAGCVQRGHRVGGFQLTLQHQRGFGGCNAGQEADAGGWGSG